MSDDYTEIPLPGLPWLTRVRFYDETWEHIAEEHSEFRLLLPTHRAGLETALAEPTSIHANLTDPDKSIVIVSEKFTYFDDPVVVPIRHVADTSGRVVTAYFSETYRGEILWSASSD